MLLGENAVGKSTILQAIAIAMMPGKNRSRLQIKNKNIIPHEHTDTPQTAKHSRYV
jgi:predicted ATPase